MTQAFHSGKGLAKYTYDGLRNRVKRLEQYSNPGAMPEGAPPTPDPASEIRYILDLTRPYNNLLMTEGAQTQRYIWGNELIEARGANPFYYLQDHLGSPIRLLNGEGANGAPLAYDEFGVPLVEAGHAKLENPANMFNPFGFTGYQMDDISGLYYAQARYYDPQAGRFTAQDVIKGIVSVPETLNAYAYCWCNPLNLVDRDGKTPMIPIEVITSKDFNPWLWYVQEFGNACKYSVQAVRDWSSQVVTNISDFFDPNTNIISGNFEQSIRRRRGNSRLFHR